MLPLNTNSLPVASASPSTTVAVAPKLPFSPIRVLPNSLVMVSGTLPFVSPGVLKEGSIEEMTAQIFENVKKVLEGVNLTLADIVDVTILMIDLKNDYAAMNKAYAKALEGIELLPTRMAYGVSELPFGAKIEMKCTAYKTDLVSIVTKKQ